MAVVAFAGGVGGAKLADGLARILPPGELTVIVNVGDDFEHYGLRICPDLDTVTYTLAGIANPETGWGLKDESWQTLSMLSRYGDETWFRLGDKDFATHILRTHLLKQGKRLTEVVQHLTKALEIHQKILPATDDLFMTKVDTLDSGTLSFQEYFVRHRWQPIVRRIWYDGNAMPSPEVMAAIEAAEVLIICPSNPLLSIDPILATGNIRQQLINRKVPCIAVSPLIHGQAVKGPAQKLMLELGYSNSTQGLMDFYNGLIDGLVVDHGDATAQGKFLETDIMMPDRQNRERLAKEVLEWAGRM